VALASCIVVPSSALRTALAADWPQTGGNPQHTNFTPDEPRPPYTSIWRADFSPEFVYSAQPVIAGDTLFQTTLNGNLYALDIATGERRWRFKAGEVIWGSAAAGTKAHGGEGQVFVASWNGFLYGLDTATGAERWRFKAGEPISGSPCLAENTLFLGTRRGNMLALTVDGKLKWKTQLSWHIYSTAAYHEGRVFVVTEDLYVHCLNAETGKPLWKSGQLNGLTHREFYPVIHQGKVLVSVTPAVHHGGPGMGLDLWGKDGSSPKNLAVYLALGKEGKLPEQAEKAQQALLDYYAKNPHYQTFFVLNEEDGADAFVPVHQYLSGGLQNIWMPPTVCADGTLITRLLLGNARLVRYDLARNRWVDLMLELRSTNNDEADYVAVGGDLLFSKEWGFVFNRVWSMGRRESIPFPPARGKLRQVSSLSGYWEIDAPRSRRRLGPEAAHPNAFNGTSPPVIAGSKFFYMSHDQVLYAYRGSN